MRFIHSAFNWLHQNHDLALMICTASSVSALSFGASREVLQLLPIALTIIASGVIATKIRSRAVTRVPASEKIWALTLSVCLLASIFPALWPELQPQFTSTACLMSLLASCADRHMRYRMVRERIQRRRGQQARWRAAKKEVMLEWKDRLRWLAGVQHDMRQPLHAMGLMLKHPELSANKNSAVIARNLNCCQQWLQELAENTIEATRFELDEARSIEVSTISSTEVCEGLGGWLRNLAESKCLRLVIKAEEQQVRTDIRRLKRVLGNLLFNAVEHCEEGCITLTYQRMGGVHQFKIKDEGTGLGAETLRKNHFNIQTASTDLPKAGIGLYVVKRLCDELQWNLTLHNEAGGGSTFSLELADRLEKEQPETSRTEKSRMVS